MYFEYVILFTVIEI